MFKSRLLALATATVCMAAPVRADDLKVLGYIENAYIGNSALMMSAKLDTGADSSSVYAQDMRIEESDGGQDWVHFRLTGDDGRTIRYKKKIVRFVLIKLKTGGTIERPVVSFDLCIGGIKSDAVVNLADRSEFDHPLLIGREFLAPKIAVSSAQTHMADDDCQPQPEKNTAS